MKKRIILVLNLALIFILLAVPVMAAGYSGIISVVESDGNDYDMLPLMLDADVPYWIDEGFIDADGLDTLIETYPHMLVEDKIIFARPVVSHLNDTSVFTTNNTPKLDSFYIVIGYNGYITVLDNVNLEPGNEFSITYPGYFNTEELSAYNFMISKGVQFALFVSDVAELSGAIFGAPTTITENGSSADLTLDNVNKRAGQRVNALPACIITNIGFWLTKNAAPTGTGYFRLRDVATDELIGTIGTIDVSTIGAVSSLYQRSDYPFYYAGGDARFTFEYEDGTAVNSVDVRYVNGGVSADNFCYYSAGVWTDMAGVFDARGTWSYATPSVMVSHDCDTGEHVVILSADTVNLSLSVDGDVNSVALGGVSVANTADNWRFLSRRSLYLEYISFYTGVGGYTEKLRFQPDDIIIDDTMPNSLNPGTYDGDITWGKNPDGVTVSLDSFLPSTQSKASISTLIGIMEIYKDNPDAIDELYTDLTEEGFERLPGGEAVNDVLTAADVPLALWWYPVIFIGIGIIGLVAYGFTTMVFTRGYIVAGQQYGSIATMCVVIGVCFAVLGMMEVIPFAVAILWAIPATAIIVSAKHYSW